jgi:hypothetical protein
VSAIIVFVGRRDFLAADGLKAVAPLATNIGDLVFSLG